MDDLLNDLIIYFEANNVGNATNEFLNRCKKAQTKQCAINGVSESNLCACGCGRKTKYKFSGLESCREDFYSR